MTYEEFYKVVKAAYENEAYYEEEIVSIVGGALKDVEAAQQSVHPTLGILAAFQAFIYAVKSSVLTAFRRPPQRG